MSPVDPPDPAQEQQFAEKLPKDEVEPVNRVAEVDRQTTEQNAQSTTGSIARGARESSQGFPGGMPVRATTLPWGLWLAAATLFGLAVVVVVKHPWIETTKRPSAQDRATELRQEAFRYCETKEWRRCWKGLDDAREFDPEGDLSPVVVGARARAAAAMGTRVPGEIGGGAGR